MEQLKKGGKRPGAGRKPTDNPKEQVTLYVPKKSIYPFGNKEKLKTALYDFIEGKKVEVQDLTQPTKANYSVDTLPKPEPIILDSYEAYKAEILATQTIPEVEVIMKRVKSDLLNWKQKQALDEIARSHSKSMYND